VKRVLAAIDESPAAGPVLITAKAVADVITSVNKPTVLVPPHAQPATSIERILVALDGSRESSAALATVVVSARAHGTEVVVLHVRDAARLPCFSDQPHHETEAWGAEFIARHCGSPARDVSLEVRVGFPADEILRVVEEQRCQLLALSWSRILAADRAPVVRRAISHGSVPSLLVPI
jgi:nucleotide-binding universal stress UspA family protein